MTEEQLRGEGWRLLAHATHFNQVAGPFWVKPDPRGVVLGLLAGESHSNGHVGTVHGGVLMTFADIALGYKVAEALGHASCATLQMSFAFAATAKIGSLLTCRPEIVRKASQVVFVRGVVVAGERVLGAADAIFKVIEPEKFAGLRG